MRVKVLTVGSRVKFNCGPKKYKIHDQNLPSSCVCDGECAPLTSHPTRGNCVGSSLFILLVVTWQRCPNPSPTNYVVIYGNRLSSLPNTHQCQTQYYIISRSPFMFLVIPQQQCSIHHRQISLPFNPPFHTP
jgi:hypothetical protein